MNRRFAATTLIGIALLLSQGTSGVVAALCPHSQAPAEACVTQAPATSDHHAGHHQTDVAPSEPDPGTKASGGKEVSDQQSLNLPEESCTHCAMHSQSNANPISFRGTETAKRVGDLQIPPAVERILFDRDFPVPFFVARAHGPPGSELPRHVLINVFRI